MMKEKAMAIPPEAIVEQEATSQPVIEECGEPLVSLIGYAPGIEVYPYYYHLGFQQAKPDCLIREGVARKLATAASKLPAGYSLVIWDGWRPYAVQQELYDRTKNQLLVQGWNEGEALEAEISRFVAKPTTNVDKPSPHLSGGAVDLTLAGPDGWLEMGTDFDDFSERALTRYFEQNGAATDLEREAMENRRLLYHLLIEEGFSNYDEEWWHFEYGTLSWARKKQATASYRGILSTES
ncbi:UNVERIFIED_CONTAM: D-alanyl-D-alanine dipeptidase [Brevibacillus sp. OAP136]